MASDYDKLYKILIVGESGVGKSSILLRYCDNMFMDSYISTIGVDFKIRTMEVDGKKIKLQIWDTAGQERFKTITSTYYRGAHGLLLVYDVGDLASFQALSRWREDISKNTNNVNMVIIGNKIDNPKVRVVSYTDASEYAENHKCAYIETSAKTNINIDDVFTKLVDKINQSFNIDPGHKDPIVITPVEKHKPCCR